MSTITELTDTAYDILKVLGKEADFLYDTIETYIKDAQKAIKAHSDLLVSEEPSYKIPRKSCLS
jgi:hypothetical protein